jgi:hypothetical protein
MIRYRRTPKNVDGIRHMRLFAELLVIVLALSGLISCALKATSVNRTARTYQMQEV